MMIRWEKVPSVVYGGKPYFYTAETPKGRHWITWNRSTHLWDISCDAMNYPVVAKDFKTPKDAMKYLIGNI
jgi:hypothetical protein